MAVDAKFAARATSMDDGAISSDDRALALLERFLRQHAPRAAAQPIGPQTPLLSSGLLDSLGVLQLVAFLDEELGVEIRDEDFSEENFATIGALLALIAHKQAVGDGARRSS